MSLSPAAAIPASIAAERDLPKGERLHRALLTLTALAIAALVLYLAIYGWPYYRLGIEDRPLSPLHPELRSSGRTGLRLGMLSVGMFAILFLYPLRKRWRWLSTIGKTRRWLNFHVLFGISTPVVVTFHTSFKWHGLAGLAYWTMILVALSGFVGRYLYAKIPRTLNSVELTLSELDAQISNLAEQLRDQPFFGAAEISGILTAPSAQEIRSMGMLRTLWTMLAMDIARPFRIVRLRRLLLPGPQRIATLGGLLASHDENLESMFRTLRRQSRLVSSAAFLNRSARIFHLWHVVHRPFSISFVALIVVHICVAISVGL